VANFDRGASVLFKNIDSFFLYLISPIVQAKNKSSGVANSGSVGRIGDQIIRPAEPHIAAVHERQQWLATNRDRLFQAKRTDVKGLVPSCLNREQVMVPNYSQNIPVL